VTGAGEVIECSTGQQRDLFESALAGQGTLAGNRVLYELTRGGDGTLYPFAAAS
jgi:hypothetical protein